MDEELRSALDGVDEAALTLFERDAATREVGVGLSQGRPAYFVTRRIEPGRSRAALSHPLKSFRAFEVFYDECDVDPRPLHGAGGIPEQAPHQPPLVCGLEIQNIDQDQRDGLEDNGSPNAGTLGCFVRLADGTAALLSNCHVIGGEGLARKGHDRIVQPAVFRLQDGSPVATLTEFVALVPSAQGTAFASNGRAPNIVDAAVAAVDVTWQQTYLSGRSTTPPSVVDFALPGDHVSKVGRTTGETHGVVRRVGVTLGPIHYNVGPCWFSRSIVIERDDGQPFAEKGDSGAVIIRGAGEAVGLLYGGLPGVPGKRPHRTYACPMQEVTRLLDCTLA